MRMARRYRMIQQHALSQSAAPRGPHATETHIMGSVSVRAGRDLEGLVAGGRVVQRLQAHVCHVSAADALRDPLALRSQSARRPFTHPQNSPLACTRMHLLSVHSLQPASPGAARHSTLRAPLRSEAGAARLVEHERLAAAGLFQQRLGRTMV